MKTFLKILFFFLLVTQICFAQWMKIGLENRGIRDITAKDNDVYVITSDSGSVYRSTDGGINWLQIVQTNAKKIALSPNGDLYLIKTFPNPNAYGTDSLFRSNNGGTIWSNLRVVEHLPPGPFLHSGLGGVAIGPTGTVFCGVESGQMAGHTSTIATSTDGGFSWTSPGWDTVAGDAFSFMGHFVLTSGSTSSPDMGGPANFYLSSDDGQTWNFRGFSGGVFGPFTLCSNGNILCGGGFGFGYLYLSMSADTGIQWIQWTLISTVIPEDLLALPQGGALVGIDSLGIVLFTDNGDSVRTINEGLKDLHILKLEMDGGSYVYAGTKSGIWRLLLSQVVSVNHTSSLPSVFRLEQNYPNPFNPSTTFRYSIPNGSKVIIKVYDILGNEIKTLVNEEKSAGSYELTFNAVNLPSGVYFYRLQAGSFVETKKMMLIK
jgi:hypothetical protein